MLFRSTVYNQRERNEDFGEFSEGLIVFSQTAQPTGGRRNDGNLSHALYVYLQLEPYLKYVISYACIV